MDAGDGCTSWMYLMALNWTLSNDRNGGIYVMYSLPQFFKIQYKKKFISRVPTVAQWVKNLT